MEWIIGDKPENLGEYLVTKLYPPTRDGSSRLFISIDWYKEFGRTQRKAWAINVRAGEKIIAHMSTPKEFDSNMPDEFWIKGNTPNNSGTYIVTVETNDEDDPQMNVTYVDLDYFDAGIKKWSLHGGKYHRLTAYMKAPNVYKPVEEDLIISKNKRERV